MPDLLQEGLPDPRSRSKFDFAEWCDGRAWRFVKGKDYKSSTTTFRENVKRWAKLNGYEVECRYFPAVDKRRREIPVTKADPIAIGLRFHRPSGTPPNATPPSEPLPRGA